MPSRSGVFFVDQTVPTTFPRNIRNQSWAFGLWSNLPLKYRPSGRSKTQDLSPKTVLSHSKDLSGLADITRGGCDNGLCIDVDLFTLLNRAFDVVFTNEVHRLSIRRARGTIRRIAA